MQDNSEKPKTVILAGVAMIVLALAFVPVVWWLIVGVQAGVQTQAQRPPSPNPEFFVPAYTMGLRVLAGGIGLASLAILVTGGVLLYKGISRHLR